MASQTDYNFGPWYDLIPTAWPIGSMEAEEEIAGGPNVHVPLTLGTSGRQVKVATNGDVIVGYSYAAGAVAIGDMVPVIFNGPVIMMASDANGCTRGQYVVPSATANKVMSQAGVPTAFQGCGFALTTADEDGEYCAVLLKNA